LVQEFPKGNLVLDFSEMLRQIIPHKFWQPECLDLAFRSHDARESQLPLDKID
jgi:hypothetical protein